MVAPAYGGAHALARYRSKLVSILWDGEADVLTGLPIAAQSVPGGEEDAGFEPIGELLATPPAPLARTMRLRPVKSSENQSRERASNLQSLTTVS